MIKRDKMCGSVMNNHTPILFYPDTSDRVTKVESEPESGKVYKNEYEYEEDRLKKVKHNTTGRYCQELCAKWFAGSGMNEVSQQ